MPPSEATPADVAAVQAHLDGNPAPAAPPEPAPQPTPQPAQQPAPQPVAQMQPAPVTPQPSNQPQDPFSAFVQPAEQTPTQPTEPTPTPQPPITPAEPTQPATEQQAQPQQPQGQTPQQPAQEPIPGQADTPKYQTYDEYMEEITGNVPEAPAQPDPSTINPDDPEAIKGFFDNLLTTAEQRFEANYAKKQAIQNTERRLWDESFEKYGTLRSNKPLRDMVHSIRMGYFQRGIAITPTQAADKLLESLGQSRRQGAADAAVISTIEQVQPAGGGTGDPQPTNLDKDQVLLDVQTGGEAALAAHLDAEINAGRL